MIIICQRNPFVNHFIYQWLLFFCRTHTKPTAECICLRRCILNDPSFTIRRQDACDEDWRLLCHLKIERDLGRGVNHLDGLVLCIGMDIMCLERAQESVLREIRVHQLGAECELKYRVS